MNKVRLLNVAGIIFGMALSLSGVLWGQTYSYWPNPVSHTNSDAWLRIHHSEIKLLKPNVLVLVADNHADMSTVQAYLKRIIAASAEGSRYHGYSDPNAPVQLQYQIKKIVDLRDHSARPWPRIWPVVHGANGKPRFVYKGMFSEKFAKAMGFKDPRDPTKFLNMEELFDRGVINEVWMVYPEMGHQRANGTTGVISATARAQVYGVDGTPIPGKFDICAGSGCVNQGSYYNPVHVTMRFTELNLSLGPGCFLGDTDAIWDGGLGNGIRGAIPEFDHASRRFFNQSLKRYGLPMDNLFLSCPLNARDCWRYPNDHTLEKGSMAIGIPKFKYKDWGQGCGSVHIPPNGRYITDYQNSQKVQSSCENYGLHNGKNGKDKRTSYYDSQIIEQYEHQWNGCGGGWQIYMRQNFPGYGSHAKMDDGSPMKSWWPYLYY